MARFKKVLAVCMAAAMSMSMMAGCGSGDNSADSETTTEQSTETEAASESETETEETTEVTEEEASVKDGDILVGLTFDEDTQDCHTYTNGGMCTLSAENGELCLDIKSTGSLDYANQIYYDGFELDQDCVYELSFDVRCDIERAMQYRIQINGSDYHSYVEEDITIGTETQHITNEFTMEETSDPAPRLCMNLGHYEDAADDSTPHKVYFDNIVLKVVDASSAQSVEEAEDPLMVNINQVGYKTGDTKLATVTDESATSYQVVDVSSGAAVAEGTLGEFEKDNEAGEKCCTVDFSEVTAAGTYKIVLDTGAESYEFDIDDDVYADIYKDSVLMLYNQRCGTALDSSISGDFAHEACHTGMAIVYGTDTALDVSGGWHDAGDYGRYVVPGAKAVQDLLLAYDDSETAAGDDAIGIPESGNGVPDILDEARYELEWMLKMQDESSGGVYHKVTGEVFPETVLAVEETAQLYLSPISYTATGDFAAVMAKASVTYKDYDSEFASTCLEAAKKAWNYMTEHEDSVGFENVGDIVTGEYDDGSLWDECFWAAVELNIATDGEIGGDFISDVLDGTKPIRYGLGWADVGYYGIYDYCVNTGDDTAKELLRKAADSLVKNYEDSGFGSTAGGSYAWGSNMTIANNGMILLMASKVTGDTSYVTYAADQLNYLLGRNAVSYCYVTGYGTRSPQSTHHRPSQVLGKSMPGMLVGGANSSLDDPYAKAVLSGLAPELCYVDNSQSYSCNEVTIYWNSPLIYLLAQFK